MLDYIEWYNTRQYDPPNGLNLLPQREHRVSANSAQTRNNTRAQSRSEQNDRDCREGGRIAGSDSVDLIGQDATEGQAGNDTDSDADAGGQDCFAKDGA